MCKKKNKNQEDSLESMCVCGGFCLFWGGGTDTSQRHEFLVFTHGVTGTAFPSENVKSLVTCPGPNNIYNNRICVVEGQYVSCSSAYFCASLPQCAFIFQAFS